MNSGSQSPHSPVFFLDKCLGRNEVANALRNHGAQVELKTDHFDQETEDAVWIPDVGQRRWIILSKDKMIRHNAVELVALLKSNTHAFVLTSGSQKGAAMAAAFVTALPDMRAMISRFPPPFVGTISASGSVTKFMTHEQLIDQMIAAKTSSQSRQ